MTPGAPSIDQLRRHVADLCVEYAITPVRPTHGHPRSRLGCRTVALQQISGPRGYWSCPYDIGYALADPSLDRPDREQAARAWAESIALDVPESLSRPGRRSRARAQYFVPGRSCPAPSLVSTGGPHALEPPTTISAHSQENPHLRGGFL